MLLACLVFCFGGYLAPVTQFVYMIATMKIAVWVHFFDFSILLQFASWVDLLDD